MSRSILSILNQIKDEEIVLPAIQREFVWDDQRIKHLLDSLLRGYPIGISLMWKTYHELQYREFQKDYRSGIRFTFKDNEKGKARCVVLDGQQRLQSLYVAIYGAYEGKELYFNLLCGQDAEDTSAEKFDFAFSRLDEVNGWNKEEPRQAWVKVRELLQKGDEALEGLLSEMTNSLQLDTPSVIRIRRNLRALLEAFKGTNSPLQVSVIDENLAEDDDNRKSEADILEIFVRINRGGVQLSRSDLIFSMLKLNWKESAEALPDFVDRINEGNSFRLDNDFVIRCLLTVTDLGVGFNLDALRKPSNVDRLRSNFENCCFAILAAIDFVKDECKVLSSHLIGGSNTLVPFVYYLFHSARHRAPHSEVGRMRRAFFLLAFTRVHTRHAESRLNKLINHELRPRAEKGDSSFPVERIAEWIEYWNAPSEIGEELIKWNPNLGLHLVQELNGGAAKYEDNRPEVDHIFPQATLRELGLEEARINHFANFWILAQGRNRNKSDKHPADYFAGVPDGEMRRAVIDKSILDFSRYDEFLQWRTPLLVNKVREKIVGPDQATP